MSCGTSPLHTSPIKMVSVSSLAVACGWQGSPQLPSSQACKESISGSLQGRWVWGSFGRLFQGSHGEYLSTNISELIISVHLIKETTARGKMAGKALTVHGSPIANKTLSGGLTVNLLGDFLALWWLLLLLSWSDNNSTHQPQTAASLIQLPGFQANRKSSLLNTYPPNANFNFVPRDGVISFQLQPPPKFYLLDAKLTAQTHSVASCPCTSVHICTDSANLKGPSSPSTPETVTAPLWKEER